MDDHAALLSVPETAKLLRISRNLAYELVSQGEIPAIRLGRVIRVPRAGLEHWLDERTRFWARRRKRSKRSATPSIAVTPGSSSTPSESR